MLAATALARCGGEPPPRDASGDAHTDARSDITLADAATEAGTVDSGDAESNDGGFDAMGDAVADVSVGYDVRESGSVDSSIADTGPRDTGVDVSTGGCVSGAVGNRAVRFRWDGSGSASTAYVRYEANQLPDTSRWHVSAASRSFGYTPVFADTYLGVGGLDLEGTAFMDVEISTAGLTNIRGVTLSIFGRSYNTTASGSFAWMTFSGSGAAPTDLVWNSAPYQWYAADATDAFVPGDSGVLLGFSPGPSSNALIVNRVEICFDAD